MDTDTNSKIYMIDYSLRDNAVEELKQDSLKNKADNNDVDECIFTGIDFFNKTGFAIAGYLDNYFRNFYIIELNNGSDSFTIDLISDIGDQLLEHTANIIPNSFKIKS